MLEQFLFFLHYAFLLLYGLILSSAFAGLPINKRNIIVHLIVFVLCGSLQLIVYFSVNEAFVWKIYPLITHLPIVVMLCAYYRKTLISSMISVTSAYLCCQPANWVGLVCSLLTDSAIVQILIQIVTLLICTNIFLVMFAPTLAKIYNRDSKHLVLFGTVPLIYYGYDYIINTYSDLFSHNSNIVSEFFPMFMCIIYMIFAVLYFREVENKLLAENKEQIIRIAIEQQAKEIEHMRKSELETKLLRHDLRLLLNNLSLSIQKDDKETSLSMISEYVTQVDAASIHRYCENDIINYTLSNYAHQCHQHHIHLNAVISITEVIPDEILISSILSNALDNAVNAVKEISHSQKEIKLMIKHSNGKLLISVKNPVAKLPKLINGSPVANQKGHGYGTQSIQYMTERLKGKVQFLVQDNWFIVRIVI